MKRLNTLYSNEDVLTHSVSILMICGAEQWEELSDERKSQLGTRGHVHAPWHLIKKSHWRPAE